MAKMTKRDFEIKEYYQLPKWILDIKGLQPADIIIYMLAIENWKLSVKNGWVDENGAVYFYLTHKSIKDKLELGKNQIIASIKRLVTAGLIIPEKENGKATTFYFQGDINEINFNIKDEKKESVYSNQSEKREYPKSDLTTTQNQTTPVTEIRPDQSEKSDINKNKIIRMNNKNNLIKKINKKDDDIKEQIEQEEIGDELKEKLIEFIEYRQEVKKPIKTYRTINALISQLGKKYVSEDHLIDSIDNAIANGYQGVFPTDLKKVREESSQTESVAQRWLKERGMM